MSPVSSIYDHLTFDSPQPTNHSNSIADNLHFIVKRRLIPRERQEPITRRYTVTNLATPDPPQRTLLKKSFPTQHVANIHPSINSNFSRVPSSASTMDFRPLITQGRRRFGTMPSSTSMIIIKKKSPPPPPSLPPPPSINHFSTNQKRFIQSIPIVRSVDIRPMRPASLSYSSSPSTSASSSTNVTNLFLPIQRTTNREYRRDNNPSSQYRTDGYDQQQQFHRHKSFTYRNSWNDDLDQSTQIPSTSSIGGEGYHYKSTIMMDSNVLRLIRRYDPGSSTNLGVITRRSLERNRGIWDSASPKGSTPQLSDCSPFSPRRSLTLNYDDDLARKHAWTPRLQRQEAILELDPPPPPPPPPVSKVRPILKYSSRSRSEFIVQPHQTEPLTIEIEPFTPSLPNESAATYQPLITTGSKRVCSALSKSDWDLRAQQEQQQQQQPSIPARPPSPSSYVINPSQEKESYRPVLGRSKSSGTINQTKDQDDTADELSAPILPNGSCVDKLKQLFVTKSLHNLNQNHSSSSLNQFRNESSDSNRPRFDHSPSIARNTSSVESQTRPIDKPVTIVQDVTPRLRKPLLRSETMIDNPTESNHRQHVQPPASTENSFDAYRIIRFNEPEPTMRRPKNIAKVEPYSMNNNAIQSLYQSPATAVSSTPSSKARIDLNSMGNTPTNSSTSTSSAVSLSGMIRHSDFLIPHSTNAKSQPLPKSSSTYITPPIPFSESIVHDSVHQHPSYNGHKNDLPSAISNSQDKYQASLTKDLHASMPVPSASNAYHYRPLQRSVEQSIREEPQIEQENSQGRRRFHRRKQMKRSKSVELHQDTSAYPFPQIHNQDLYSSYRIPKSTRREYQDAVDHFSSSSSSSSSTADLERVNRAALLRYKSLDSIAFNNRKSNINGRSNNNNNNNHRRIQSKTVEYDFDSDDSVCGIPKPRRLCTSSKNVTRSERTILDPPIPVPNTIVGSSGTSTGITNAVRRTDSANEQIPSVGIEGLSSTTKTISEKKEGGGGGGEKISFAESQFYARSSDVPSSSNRRDLLEEKKPELPIENSFSQPCTRTVVSSSIIINPFERLRPMEIRPTIEEATLQIFEQPQDTLSKVVEPVKIPDETNDSSTSTNTSRSIHLPVEKQRGLSEIIRKRNSKSKVEDYKRSIQKSSAVDEDEPTPSALPSSNNEPEPPPPPPSVVSTDHTPKFFDVPINVQNRNDQRAQLSIERLNSLLSQEDEQEIDETLSVADKRNLFETINKDTQIGGTLPRSKSFKTEESALTTTTTTKKYASGNQRSQTDNIVKTTDENETFDDDISKLSFKEKMTLFNKKKPAGLTPTSSLKNNRNRQTQPITAEEVQAAVNLTPPSSKKELSDGPEESENLVPVSKRLEQLKELTMKTPENPPGTTRQTPTMKYSAKKTNTDEQQRAKTVDIVRLKADSTAVKPKETTKSDGTTPAAVKTNTQNVISVLKSDTVSVLKPDDHLDDFFADTTKDQHDDSIVPLNTDDLNRLAQNTTRLQSQAARVRPPRRQQQGAKNPLRQIQATIPIVDEYTEVHTNLSEQEIRRLKRAQIAENAGLAQEALAALATTENFAEINLRKVDQTPVAKFAYEPYKDLMLILIKGRRHCSLRLVNPHYQSLNEGDCYLLLTPLKVFAWFGRRANSAEKSRTTDLIDYLKQHRDFGLRNEVKYFLLDQGKDDTENDLHAEFRDVLQGENDDYQLIDDVIDDDFYEMNITELNRVYRVENDLLMPLNEFCFHSLSVKILDPNEVLVFDFGSELYVWNGKLADKNKRTMGLQLAQQLWNDPYDASECIIHPFDPLNDKNEQINLTRPAWCIFGKQNQNVETLLFKGKFIDWPSDLQELKSQMDPTNNLNKLPVTQRPLSIVDALKPADVDEMLDQQASPVNFIIDQINFGRGKQWYDPSEKRGHQIQTISLDAWHIFDNDRHPLSPSSSGQFYSDDVYIIRWKYKLIPLGNVERKADISRDRLVYWIWQGHNANLNEKGISSILGVFLAEEKGAHIHVIEEHEEAIFLQLFHGTLTIHRGQRHLSIEKKFSWRLYIFRGEIGDETHWWELSVSSTNLRSRTSFLLINASENLMLLWHGCLTNDEQQIKAKNSVMKLRQKFPEEFHFDGDSDDIELFEMQEGDEIELFWEGMNERNHQRKYHSFLNQRQDFSPIRIFHLSSLHGPFIAQELIYPLHSSEHIAVFPFTQPDLYELHQPALCLIDTDEEIYIWQGWNDQADDELGMQLSNANLLVRGPKDIRFTTERRCAFRTAIDYYKKKTGSSTVDIPCSVVYAGLEPIEFINLFPKWNVHSKARQQNQLEGKKLYQKDSVIDLLNHLCREQYTIEELRTRPLPEGVDPSKIESYLSDNDFQREFRMSKDEFYALPYWKQTNIKKPLGFF